MMKRHDVIRAVMNEAERQGAIVLAVDTMRGLVLCQRDSDFVSWKFGYIAEEQRAFFHWGNYRDNRDDAQVDYETRV